MTLDFLRVPGLGKWETPTLPTTSPTPWADLPMIEDGTRPTEEADFAGEPDPRRRASAPCSPRTMTSGAVNDGKPVTQFRRQSRRRVPILRAQEPPQQALSLTRIAGAISLPRIASVIIIVHSGRSFQGIITRGRRASPSLGTTGVSTLGSLQRHR